MTDWSDRRVARRFAMSLPVRLVARDASSPELRAQTRDVSYQGLYLDASGGRCGHSLPRAGGTRGSF